MYSQTELKGGAHVAPVFCPRWVRSAVRGNSEFTCCVDHCAKTGALDIFRC
jgi:hypothetical protein